MILTKRKQQSWIPHIKLKKKKKLTTKNGKKTINSYYVERGLIARSPLENAKIES